MTIEEAIEIINQFRERQGNSSDDIEAFDMGIKALEKQDNNFNEVVDFFNDIMDTLAKDYIRYNSSSKSVIYARNRVYDVFSRRYKIKELERNGESETIQEV